MMSLPYRGALLALVGAGTLALSSGLSPARAAAAPARGHWQVVKRWVVPPGFDSIEPTAGEDATIGRAYAVRVAAPRLGQDVSGQILSQYSSADGARGERDYSYDARHPVFIKLIAPPRQSAYWWINSWATGPVGTTVALLVWQKGQ